MGSNPVIVHVPYNAYVQPAASVHSPLGRSGTGRGPEQSQSRNLLRGNVPKMILVTSVTQQTEGA